MTIEFQGWPKTPRLFRDITITEKIDGTNAAVVIEPLSPGLGQDWFLPSSAFDWYWKSGKDWARLKLASNGYTPVRVAFDGGPEYLVAAQSRKRLITPEDDNFGFARWVFDNATELARLLGPGRHFGEWWGSGIQRGYGLTNGEKRFSLFNVDKYGPIVNHDWAQTADELRLNVVPVLYRGDFDTELVGEQMWFLRNHGSLAAPGFMKPEGVVVYHHAANQTFKALLENDDKPKGQG
jgi:hypothetical protein